MCGSFSICLFRGYIISCVEGAVFIILFVVFYGYDTWSPTLSEKQRLMMFEKSVFRKEQGEFHVVYFSPNIVGVISSRKTRWAGHVAGVGEKKNTYRILVGPLGKRRWWGNTKTYSNERVQDVVGRLRVAGDGDK